MSINVPLLLIFFFILKHVVCDFFMQGPYQFMNKGKFGHPGGLLHAGINGIGTMIVIAIVLPATPVSVIIGLGLAEYVIHYFIDFIKIRVNSKMKWTAESSKEYWFSLGIDQALHWMVYLMIMYALVSSSGVTLLGWFTFVSGITGLVLNVNTKKRANTTGVN